MSIDMSMLHPRLRNALETLQSQCSAKGLALGFSDGYRSAAEQDALYAQGRTLPGSIVTNARGGYSQHNWGIAADFFQNIRGREWEVPFFNTVGPLAESLGLSWGGRWTDFTDRPHLYLPDWGDTPTPLINAYGLHGYDAFRKTWGSTSETVRRRDWRFRRGAVLAGYAAISAVPQRDDQKRPDPSEQLCKCRAGN